MPFLAMLGKTWGPSSQARLRRPLGWFSATRWTALGPYAMTRTPPKRILRSGEEGDDMKSDADEAMKAKEARFARPRAVGCAVVAAVVLAVILAWALGFFTWLAS